MTEQDTLEANVKKMNEAIDKLLNQVANLAVRIDEVKAVMDEHVKEKDAHHPAMLSKKEQT